MRHILFYSISTSTCIDLLVLTCFIYFISCPLSAAISLRVLPGFLCVTAHLYYSLPVRLCEYHLYLCTGT